MILAKHEIKRGAGVTVAVPQNGASHGAGEEKPLKRSGLGSKPAN